MYDEHLQNQWVAHHLKNAIQLLYIFSTLDQSMTTENFFEAYYAFFVQLISKIKTDLQ